MRLNAKIGLILIVPLLGMVAVAAIGLQALVMQRFEALERRELEQNQARLTEALSSEFNDLERVVRDWALWDDTANYMAGTNPGFVDSNMSSGTFDNLGLDGLLLFDRAHRLHDDYTYDRQAKRFIEADPQLVATLSKALSEGRRPLASRGIVQFGGRVVQLAHSPVLWNDSRGEPQGTMVMMRFLDATQVEELAQRIRVQLHFHRIDAVSQDPRVAAASRALQDGEHHVDASDPDTIHVYSTLQDLRGEPAVLMQISMSRDIVRQGRRAIAVLLMFTFAAMLVLTIGTFVAIRRVALRRLSRMSRQMLRFGSDGSTTERLPDEGNDEITRLARAVNAMLDGLERAHTQRRRAAERQRELNALLVRIASDDALAGGDQDALFRVLTGSLPQGAQLERWSLWLRDPQNALPICWRHSGDSSEDCPEPEAVGAALAGWDGTDGAALPVAPAALRRPRHGLLLPFAVEDWQGALLVEADDGDWAADEIAFLVSATSLVERSLHAHFLRQREQSLRQQAEFDGLTGLANRAMFERSLRRALAQWREGAESLALLFIDLDRFKPVNDQHGHAIGDWLLRQVAHRLRERLRSNDLVARLGGDEFCAILFGLPDDATAGRVAEKLIEALRQPFQCGEIELRIGCSIGVACVPADGVQYEDVLHAADMAMYAAKQAGRDTWRAPRTDAAEERRGR